MIKMSLDKERVVPEKLSPDFSSLSEQPPPAKSLPPPTKNGFHLPGNTSGPATQRVAKRRYSVGVAFKGSAKRRRRTNSDSQSEPRLPSHFLLGGNIFDPLNLNSLLDEDVNKATNRETPQSSPLPSRGGDPIEILVPRDITDPLNLKGGGKEGKDGGGVLLSPLKSRKRHRNRHHGGGDKEMVAARLFPSTSGPAVSGLTTGGSVSTSPLSCELNTAITCREDIAPPPILPRRHTHPPPGGSIKLGNQRDSRHRRRHRTTSTRSDIAATTVQPSKFQTPLVGGAKGGRCGDVQMGAAQPPQRKKDKLRYHHGQHSCYYGYHGFYGEGREGRVGAEEDSRLRLLEADWFRDKKVLDVGCGAGHLTLAVARKFNPSHILGVELDEHLVHAAKQNIRHFLSHDLVVTERKSPTPAPTSSCPSRTVEEGGGTVKVGTAKVGTAKVGTAKVGTAEGMQADHVEQEFQQALSLLNSFPLSLRVSRGPLSAPPLLLPPSSSSSRFPNNITFIQGNYVSSQHKWPGRGQYDVIVCLGVTKWVHLHSGDVGVVRLFTRAYQSLSPGGLFILEPQPWSSYSRSRSASETTFHHFRTVRLKPEQFTSYLTEAVGFSSYRLLTHTGNQRSVYLFHKGPAQRK